MTRSFAFALSRKFALAALFVASVALVAVQARAQDDPPDEAGRLSWSSGTVSVQPAGTQDWGQAYPNLTLGPGDRIFTDADGWAEVQLGQTYVRIGPNSDVTLVADTPDSIDFGIAQGAVHLRTFALWPGQFVSVSTPNGNARFENEGELRVDVLPDDNASIFTNLGGQAAVSGAGGFEQWLGSQQSLELAGTNPVYPQWLEPAAADNLDAWSQQRDQWIQQSASYQYVNPDVPGVADLDANGDWDPDTDYGPIWYPRNVPVGWAPYHYGHWIYRNPWGWIWVEDEPWGYAPFHYGRWVFYRNRWGWVPGPRHVRPVWSPALVVFVGGIRVGGVSVSAWFPLGPGEPYRPWYRCSPHYLDRVNLANIHSGRRVRVWKTYRDERLYSNVVYVNRAIGGTAMRHDDFTSGRSTRQHRIVVDRRQFERVQPVAAPVQGPRDRVFVTRPIAAPRTVVREQPRFINRHGRLTTGRPGATTVAPPVRPIRPVRVPQGRRTAPPPSDAGRQQVRPGQSPVRPVGKPIPAPAGREEGRRQQQPNAGQTPVRPEGKPIPAPAGREEGRRQQQPNAGQTPIRPEGRPIPAPPERRNEQTNRQPEQQQVRPVGRPIPAPPERREARPSAPSPNTPGPSTTGNERRNERTNRQPEQQQVRPVGRPAAAPPERREARPNPPSERGKAQPAPRQEKEKKANKPSEKEKKERPAKPDGKRRH